MASGLYAIAKQSFLGASPPATRIDVDTNVIRARAINTTDEPFDPTATNMSGITAYVGATDQTLTSPTIVTTGTTVAFDANDATFPSVAPNAGKTIGAIVVYQFVSNDLGSTPIAYLEADAPVTPNTGNVNVAFNAGVNRIFAL